MLAEILTISFPVFFVLPLGYAAGRANQFDSHQVAGAAGWLLGLSESQIANAIAMAASTDASFAVLRAKPLSQWKGLASAQSALGAMNTLLNHRHVS